MNDADDKVDVARLPSRVTSATCDAPVRKRDPYTASAANTASGQLYSATDQIR